MEQGYRQIFKQREFMKMTGANFINRFGDSIDMIAFTWLVFELTGSASWCDYAGSEYDTECARSALCRSNRRAYGEKEHHDCL